MTRETRERRRQLVKKGRQGRRKERADARNAKKQYNLEHNTIADRKGRRKVRTEKVKTVLRDAGKMYIDPTGLYGLNENGIVTGIMRSKDYKNNPTALDKMIDLPGRVLKSGVAVVGRTADRAPDAVDSGFDIWSGIGNIFKGGKFKLAVILVIILVVLLVIIF